MPLTQPLLSPQLWFKVQMFLDLSSTVVLYGVNLALILTGADLLQCYHQQLLCSQHEVTVQAI